MRTQRLELRLVGDKRQLDGAAATAASARARSQEILADARQIVLSDEDAARPLDALEDIDEDIVTRLRDLRQRA